MDSAVKISGFNEKKHRILVRIKESGGLWSYDGIPEGLEDDSVIEQGLMHLDLYEVPVLFECWERSRVEKVWRERMLPQGSRLNILNFLLACIVFHVDEPGKILHCEE